MESSQNNSTVNQNTPAGVGPFQKEVSSEKTESSGPQTSSEYKDPNFNLFSLFFSHLKKLGRDV
jgi:hypothetical protein